MDIGSGSGYPAGNLSNFHPYQFEIDGVTCNSMEGFLQSLKFSNPEMQEHVCSLVGKKKLNLKAKRRNGLKTKRFIGKVNQLNATVRNIKNCLTVLSRHWQLIKSSKRRYLIHKMPH